MRILVVLYHLGDSLARSMERSKVESLDVQQWCADWEDAAAGASKATALGWLTYTDSLARLIQRYHGLMSGTGPRSE